jgi:transketolase
MEKGDVLQMIKSYEKSLISLQEKARWVRRTTLQMIAEAGSGHPGGSLSEIEILVSLYYKILRLDPKNPQWPDRDRFILSKGHCCPPLYAILADKGYFPIETLHTLRKFGSILQGHPSIITPGIDTVSGSLGNGLSVGTGMAMAGRKNGKDYRVYVLLGDGEIQEGCVWEAAMCAAHHKLCNITAIVDYNKLQINGETNTIMNLEPLADKWAAFGWNVREVDGHSFPELLDAFQEKKENEKPSVIIAHTIKGKSVSFMENDCGWHGKCPSPEQLTSALEELEV